MSDQSFIEVSLIIEGGLAESVLFDTEEELDTWESNLRTEYQKIGAVTQWQAFVIRHDHPNDQECECVQYLTDHSPAFTIG